MFFLKGRTDLDVGVNTDGSSFRVGRLSETENKGGRG